MKRTLGAIASAVILSALPGLAIAQQQVVKPPVANYWVNLDTAAGMTMPGMAGMGGLMAGMLMDFVPPAEVARLVREKVVLPSSVTECTVPAEVVKRSGGSPFFNFIAYGPEANFAQPPRPKDPKQAWDPLWTVKVRFKSTASTLLGDAAGGGGRRPARTQAPASETAPESSEGQAAGQPAQKPAADPLKEGVNILRGIFGR